MWGDARGRVGSGNGEAGAGDGGTTERLVILAVYNVGVVGEMGDRIKGTFGDIGL